MRGGDWERAFSPSTPLFPFDTNGPEFDLGIKSDPNLKALLCEIAVSCPRIADRPADPFSDLPNSMMGSPARLPLSLPPLLDSIKAPEESIQPSKVGRQDFWDVRDESSVDRAQSGDSGGPTYRRIWGKSFSRLYIAILTDLISLAFS